MAKTRKAKSAAKPELKDLGGAAWPQTAHLLQAQGEIAKELERFTSRWMERRREAAETMSESANALRQAAPGPGTVPSMLQSWQRISIECMADDASDWLVLWSTCANILTTGELEAESELAKMAGMANENGKLPTRIPV